MDAASDSSVRRIVFMKSAQIGATEILNNIIGYFIDQDPSPIMIVEPTLEIADAWSKDRLAPMLRDTKCLQGRVKDVRSRDSGNTIRHKSFPGGHITVAGANSAASLASRPIRVVLCDEVDRYPKSAGTEGSPKKLAYKRATTFWNRLEFEASTPTIKNESEIEAAYEHSDQRKYFVPCPQCSFYQLFQWSQVRWPPDEPHKAIYICEHCEANLTDKDKLWMVSKGEWRALKPFAGTAGFWVNELYSPWVSFADMVKNFLEAKKRPDTLRVWVNTSLAETWEESGGETIEETGLYARREHYGPEIPEGVVVLTCGVDVQDDRIEAEVVGWGRGEESWGIEEETFHGATTDPEGGAWALVDLYLEKTFLHVSGVQMRIACTCIDTGHRTKEAYAFIRPRQIRQVYAVKGSNQAAHPLVCRPSTRNIGKIKLFPVGVDTAKETIYSRLKLVEPGPGYQHFPMAYDHEYFLQLTGEKVVTTYHKGFPKRAWVKIRPRNEALDRRVYAQAALAILNVDLDHLADIFNEDDQTAGGRVRPSWLSREARPEAQPPGHPKWLRR